MAPIFASIYFETTHRPIAIFLTMMDDSQEDLDCNEALNQSEEEAVNAFQFELIPYTDRRCTKFGIHRRTFTTRLQQHGGNLARLLPNHVLPELIEHTLEMAIEQQILSDRTAREEDWIMINMSSDRLQSAYQSHRVSIGDWILDGTGSRAMLEKMSQVLNSNETFQMDDTFHIEITHVRNPGTGRGRNQNKPGLTPVDQLLKRKKNVIRINNYDDLCCARAIVTAKAHKDYGSGHWITRSCKRGFPLQEQYARELHNQAGVPLGACGLGEIQLFQNSLPEYQLIVIDVELAYQLIFKGPSKPKEKQLVLIKHKEHYHTCTSLTGFFGTVYYCVECEKSFAVDDSEHHQCKGKRCYACEQTCCTEFQEIQATLYCTECCRSFFTQQCYQNHLYYTTSGKKASGNSVCEVKKRCPGCNKVEHSKQKIRQHQCGHSRCPSCHRYVDITTHKCYIQPIVPDSNARKRKRDERVPPPLFVYFDIEAMQDTGIHVANLVCAETNEEDTSYVFSGATCIEQFLAWLQTLTQTDDVEYLRHVIAIAHNFQGYDSYFILEELYKQCVCPKQIVNGAKILSMSLDHIKFIDSMAFLQMSLASFTKAFGLQELKKGFFPHFFNRAEYQHYVGPMPAKDYYDPKSMKPERKQQFDTWYQSKLDEQATFHFQQELIAYCQSDVQLLKQRCMKFQQEFQSLTNFNPMEQCITIASACNRFFRTNCILPGTLACEPVLGWYGSAKPHSIVALEWLNWVEHSENKRLLHAGNQGECQVQIGLNKTYVDGYDPNTNTIYEFNGCFFHGCTTCFNNRDQTHAKLNNKTMAEVYQSTMHRIAHLQHSGYNVIVMWECAWKQLKQQNLNILPFLNQLDLTNRLRPRDAFFGGRTNAVQLYYQVQPGEQIRYVDYTSLYPFVNKNCQYPVGHPLIINNPSFSIEEYFGLALCKILPPRELYHPVLPYRCNGKLMFPLCRTCAETQVKFPLSERVCQCSHNEDERALTGTWCTPEVMEAKRQGYTIVQLYEVWHFPNTSNLLFKQYVDTFLKLKQEASGWPADVGEDPEKRQDYIVNYLRHENIQLDAEKIDKNPGKRSTAKMMLNSFWGKFGEQSNKTQVQAFTAPSAFYKLLQNEEQQIHSIRIVNEHMIEVVHDYIEDSIPTQVNINIFIACFTTCWARLKLYEALQQLQQQVLYFDTDSVIYKWKPNAPELPLGQYLGQFTNELDDPSDYITEFAAAGPKNYGYRTLKGKTECKVRGFSLNTRGQEQLNFDILKKNIIDEVTQPQPVANSIPVFNPHKIVRNPTTKQLSTETQIKRYQLVFDKRVVDSSNFQSYPYGYQDSNSQGTATTIEYPLLSLQSMVDNITQDSVDIYQGLLDGTLDIFQ